LLRYTQLKQLREAREEEVITAAMAAGVKLNVD
jgi:hypothetical protein